MLTLTMHHICRISPCLGESDHLSGTPSLGQLSPPHAVHLAVVTTNKVVHTEYTIAKHSRDRDQA